MEIFIVIVCLGGLAVAAISLLVLSYSNARSALDTVKRFGIRLGKLQERLSQVESTLEGFEKRQTPLEAPEQTKTASDKVVEEPVAFSKKSPPVSTEAKVQETGPPPMKVQAAPLKAPKLAASKLDKQTSRAAIDWEKFTGARLFAWVGGFALFLGMAFLVKYSIDQGLISPLIRVAIGFLTGAGTIVGGLYLWKRGYATTAHTLCAVGPAILYAVVFAAYDFYGFIGAGMAFILMILVTVAAFLLAVRLDSRYIALLGLVGGFLTPALLSSGEDNPFGLFGYIAILNLGLAMVALRKQWGLLVALAAFSTIFTEIAWMDNFFHVSKSSTAIVVFLALSLLYVGIGVQAKRWKYDDQFVQLSVWGIPFSSMLFVAYMFSFNELAQQPGLIMSALFLLNVMLVGLVWLEGRYWIGQIAGGGLTFLVLLAWTSVHLTPALLESALLYVFAFATLHAVFPLVMQKYRKMPEISALWSNLYPILMLLVIVWLVLERSTIPFAVWPIVFLIDVVAVFVAFLLGAIWVGVVVMAVTLGIAWIGLMQLPSAAGLDGLLAMMMCFSLGFFAVGVWWERKAKSSSGRGGLEELMRLPVLSVILPFLLLSTTCLSIPLHNPAPIFGLGLLLVVLMLSLVFYQKADIISIASLSSIVILQFSWVVRSFDAANPMVALPWYFVFFAVFAVFPFLFQSMKTRLMPWWAAALAGPLQFFFVYHAVSRSMETNWIGLLPGFFAAVYLVLLIRIVGKVDDKVLTRPTQLALFGGVALFFISLVFPLQFQKEWLTIGWALEGTALVWLFHRVPHAGLKRWGLALLIISFVRLALNPFIFTYHARGDVAIFNWYLYLFGIVAACFFAAAWFWRPRGERVLELPAQPVLYGLGTALIFILMNIEIADFFSKGTVLTFQFGTSFGQDLAYSLAWALFGLVLMVVGLRIDSSPARLASLVLISVTTFKLFFYDLWSLGQLYRVVAFVGLAAILILVSSLYQKRPSADRSGEPLKGSKH